MNEHRPARERVLNREAELNEFLQVVDARDRPCAVLLEDQRKGIGKSSFLELVEEAVSERSIAVTRMAVKKNRDSLWLAESVFDGLIDYIQLPLFQRLSIALAAQDSTAFGWQSLFSASTALTVDQSHLSHSPISVHVDVPTSQWSERHERAAKRACRDALVEDLKLASKTRPVVVLLDQFERASTDIVKWLEETLCKRVFDEQEGFGLLVFAVAANRQAFSSLPHRLGSRTDEFIHHIQLRGWSDEQISRWLSEIGLSINFLPQFREFVEQGVPLKVLTSIAAQLCTLSEAA